jgi:UDP-N-acetylglucosamine 2-epimerase (non-hydrolysing)
MPEEINRLVTDQLSDLLFTPSRDGDENLKKEGIPPEKIHFVGNIMIDSLVRLLPKAEARWGHLSGSLNLSRYGIATLHRPSNVDDPGPLREILQALEIVGETLPVLFPVHPRTRARIETSGFRINSNSVRLIEPLGYLDFLALQSHAALILTDSGGVQEETTYLGIPCLTLRPNTERPITVIAGTNRLVESKRDAIITAAEAALSGHNGKTASEPLELWDGRTAERIAHLFTGMARSRAASS